MTVSESPTTPSRHPGPGHDMAMTTTTPTASLAPDDPSGALHVRHAKQVAPAASTTMPLTPTKASASASTPSSTHMWPWRFSGRDALVGCGAAFALLLARSEWYLCAMTTVVFTVGLQLVDASGLEEDTRATADQAMSKPQLQRCPSRAVDMNLYHARVSLTTTENGDPNRITYTLTVRVTEESLEDEHATSECSWQVVRCYHEFRNLRKSLDAKFPQFPPKLPRLLHGLTICQDLLKKREALLQEFIAFVVQDPEYANHPATRAFLVSKLSEDALTTELLDDPDDPIAVASKASAMFQRLSRDQQLTVLKLGHELRSSEDSPSLELLRMTEPEWLIRFLTSYQWSFDATYAALTETIRWREETQVSQLLDVHFDLLKTEHETGKVYVPDFLDKAGNAILMLRPHLENTYNPEGNLLNIIFNLERAIAYSKSDKVTVLVDLSEFSIRKAPPAKAAKHVLSVFQRHFVETLNQAIIYDAPWIFNSFFNVIKVVLDEDTQDKIVFVKESDLESSDAPIHRVLDASLLRRHVGPAATFSLDPTTYLMQQRSHTDVQGNC